MDYVYVFQVLASALAFAAGGWTLRPYLSRRPARKDQQ